MSEPNRLPRCKREGVDQFTPYESNRRELQTLKVQVADRLQRRLLKVGRQEGTFVVDDDSALGIVARD